MYLSSSNSIVRAPFPEFLRNNQVLLHNLRFDFLFARCLACITTEIALTAAFLRRITSCMIVCMTASISLRLCSERTANGIWWPAGQTGLPDSERRESPGSGAEGARARPTNRIAQNRPRHSKIARKRPKLSKVAQNRGFG